MSLKYIDLLRKFSGDEELISLINFIFLYDQESREETYTKNGKYPERRELLGLLKNQLLVTKEHLQEVENELK